MAGFGRRTRFAAAALAVGALLLGTSTVHADEKSGLERFGDYMQLFMPAAAYSGTLIMQDREGALQFTKSGLTTLSVVYVMKENYAKLRPNSGSRTSFPSGHTAAAFSGAAFLQTRYGPAVGVPAYALGFVTAYSRVNADRHFVDDTVAGASIAVFSNWLHAAPHRQKVAVEPLVLKGGYGLNVTIAEGGERGKSAAAASTFHPRFRYQLDFGPAYMKKNEITSPAAGGTVFDLHDFEQIDDPTTTAAGLFTLYPGGGHELTAVLAPFESRDKSRLTGDVRFQGSIYPAGTDVVSSYRMFDLRLQYAYDLRLQRPWTASIGASVAVQFTSFTLADTGGGRFEEATEWTVLPLLYAKAGVYISRKAHIDIDGSSMSTSRAKHDDGGILLKYDVDEHWEAGAGYRYFWRKIDTAELRNEVSYDITVFSLSYAW